MSWVSESIKQGPLTATGLPFWLHGGIYVVETVATGYGSSLYLDALGPDGVTYLHETASITANTAGNTPLYLPPGQYRWTVGGTATGFYGSVNRVPV